MNLIRCANLCFRCSILEQRTDVAFRFGQLQDSSLHAKLLCRSRLYIVASPEYLAKHGYPKSPNVLDQHQLIGFSKVPALNTWPLDVEVDDRALTIHAKLKASNGETVRQLTLMGNGISCLSQFLVSKDLQQGRLVALFEDEIHTSSNYPCGVLSARSFAEASTDFY